MQKQAAPLAATSGPDVSYKNLFNPLSPIMGGGDKYPEFVANMFPGNARAAWLTAKAGAATILAAALFGGIRGVQHLNRVAEMRDKDDPGQKLDSQLSTTFAVPLGKHAAMDGVPTQEVMRPPAISLKNITNTAVPVGAFLLAAATAWKTMDTVADKRRNRLLTDAVAAKSNTMRDLMQTRARIAKGTISDAEVSKALGRVDDESNYVKTAGADRHPIARGGFTGLGLLVLALAGASAAGSYAYFKASDPGNLKYKATKAGLEEYARNKTGMTPITTIPQDAGSYFKAIDEGAKPKSTRELPEQEATRKPISITL